VASSDGHVLFAHRRQADRAVLIDGALGADPEEPVV
jgi:hypothetical protein